MRLDSYHPVITLLYFIGVIAASLMFDHPLFLAVTLISAMSYAIKLNGRRGWRLGIRALACAAIFAVFYAGFQHFGVTVLAVNLIGNQLTLEALTRRAVLGLQVAAVALWFSCVHTLVTEDQLVFLLGRLFPRLALGVSILLRGIPHIKEYTVKIDTAQKGIGQGSGQGNTFTRVKSFFRRISILFTWSADHWMQLSDSMRCRGSTLKGRTAYALYRFDHRDRAMVLVFAGTAAGMLMASLLGQTKAVYDPVILVGRPTLFMLFCCICHAVFCALPLLVQCWGEWRFSRQRRRITE